MVVFTRVQRAGLLLILMLTTGEAIEMKNKIEANEMSMKFYDSARDLEDKVWMGLLGENEVDDQLANRHIQYFQNSTRLSTSLI